MTTAVSLSTACVGVEDTPGLPQAPNNPAAGCDLDDAPRCLASCGQLLEVAGPTCRSGRWSCGSGIDSRVCCDPEVSPGTCPTWERNCFVPPEVPEDPEEPVDPDAGKCPSGYTCVQSRTHPTPADTGVCRFGDLHIPEQMGQCSVADATPSEFLPLLDTGPVKVQGMLVIDTLCGDNTCTADNMCCNNCYGSYRLILDGGTPGREEAALPIHTEAIACVGTNCGITCTPMQPGRRYVIWGTYMPSELSGDVGKLYYYGHCPL